MTGGGSPPGGVGHPQVRAEGWLSAGRGHGTLSIPRHGEQKLLLTLPTRRIKEDPGLCFPQSCKGKPVATGFYGKMLSRDQNQTPV